MTDDRSQICSAAISENLASTITDILKSLVGNRSEEGMDAFLWSMRVVINFGQFKGEVTEFAKHAGGESTKN